jgi:hypothetical protein
MSWEDSVTSQSDTGSVIDFRQSSDVTDSMMSHTTDQYSPSKGRREEKEAESWDEKAVEELMEKDFVVALTETPTFFILDRLDESVPTTADYLEEVKKRNERYKEVLDEKKIFAAKFSNKEVQTLNKFAKNKFADTEKKETVEVEVACNAWEIYDEYQMIKAQEEREREEREMISSLATNKPVDSKEEEDEDEEENVDGEGDEDGDNTSVRTTRYDPWDTLKSIVCC